MDLIQINESWKLHSNIEIYENQNLNCMIEYFTKRMKTYSFATYFSQSLASVFMISGNSYKDKGSSNTMKTKKIVSF